MSAAPPSASPATPAQRGCLATLAIAVLMFGIVAAGFVASDAVAGMPSQPVTVAAGVVIRPVGEWEFGGRSDDATGILLSKGAASLFVLVEHETRDPVAAVETVFAEWRAESGTQITTGGIERIDLRGRQPAARGFYAGSFSGIGYPVEGEVTAVQGTTASAIFDAWAGAGDFVLSRPEVDQMIREATIP